MEQHRDQTNFPSSYLSLNLTLTKIQLYQLHAQYFTYIFSHFKHWIKSHFHHRPKQLQRANREHLPPAFSKMLQNFWRFRKIFLAKIWWTLWVSTRRSDNWRVSAGLQERRSERRPIRSCSTIWYQSLGKNKATKSEKWPAMSRVLY